MNLDSFTSVLIIPLTFIACIMACSVQQPSSEPILNEQPKIKNNANGIRCGFLDSKGHMWFGTNDGLFKFQNNSFRAYGVEDGLSHAMVTAITEDHDGNLWFGTGYGLTKYNGDQFIPVPVPWSDTSSFWLDKVYPIVNPNEVQSILQDQAGDLWIGTNGAGVYQYNGEIFIQHLNKIGAFYEDSLQHNIVQSISEDHDGNLWFTSLSHGGITKFNGEDFIQFMPEDGLSDDMYRTSFVDRKGGIWFGSNGNRKGGLDYFNGDSFSYFNEEDGICSKNIMSILEDQNGLMWLGGNKNLCLYQHHGFEEFLSSEGEMFDRLNFVVQDQNQNIWFGGMHGLWMYNGTDVMDYSE